MIKRLVTSAILAATALGVPLQTAAADETLFVPSLSYRTGPFAGGGIPLANGYKDYFT